MWFAEGVMSVDAPPCHIQASYPTCQDSSPSPIPPKNHRTRLTLRLWKLKPGPYHPHRRQPSLQLPSSRSAQPLSSTWVKSWLKIHRLLQDRLGSILKRGQPIPRTSGSSRQFNPYPNIDSLRDSESVNHRLRWYYNLTPWYYNGPRRTRHWNVLQIKPG